MKKVYIPPRIRIVLALTFGAGCGVTYFVFKSELGYHVFDLMIEPFLARFILASGE